MKVHELKKEGLKAKKLIAGYSSTLRLSLHLRGMSSVDFSSRAVVQLLEAFPLAHECSISVYVPSTTLLEDMCYFLSVWKKIRFGDARAVPMVYMFVPLSVNLPRMVDCIKQYNDIDNFLHLVTVADVAQPACSEIDLVPYWEMTHRYSIDHIVLVHATTLNEFPCAFKRLRRISGILFDYTPTVWLHVDDLPKYCSRQHYMELLDALPFIHDTLNGVPLLPPGPFDVLYCATRLAKYCLPYEKSQFQIVLRKSLVKLCVLLRSNFFEFRQDQGCSTQILLPTIDYVHFARFIEQYPETIATVMTKGTQTTLGVRRNMADYVND